MEQYKIAGYSAWGGIILSVIGITSQDILKTIVLGVIGTVVSFLISTILDRFFKQRK